MGGAWVFPGGAVDADEAAARATSSHRRAAVREVDEEAGITLTEPDALVAFSRWITPRPGRDPLRHALLPRAGCPTAPSRRSTATSASTSGWFAPTAALEAYARERADARLPDDQDLEQLSAFAQRRRRCSTARAAARSCPIEPRVVIEGEVARVMLPGEPGYEDRLGVEQVQRGADDDSASISCSA